MGKNKKNNKPVQQESTLETRIFKLFKDIPSNDITTIKSLVQKVEEKLKSLDKENQELIDKATNEAKDIVNNAREKENTIKAEAHKSAEAIKATALEKGKKEAEELKKSMTDELDKSIENYELKIQQLEQVEKDFLEKANQLHEKETEFKRYMADRIEKDHAAFDERVKGFENTFKDNLTNKIKRIEESFKERVEKLIQENESALKSAFNLLDQKLASEEEISKLKTSLEISEKKASFFKTQLSDYPPQKHEELQLLLAEANNKVELYAAQLKDKVSENIRLDKDIKRLSIDKDIVIKYDALLKEKYFLEEQLAQFPSLDMIDFYKQQVKDVETLQERLEEKNIEINRLNGELSKHRINKETSNYLENVNRGYQVLYDKLVEDYRKLEEGYQNTTSARFKGLVQIDSKYASKQDSEALLIQPLDLKQFCVDFRNSLAFEKEMYYDEQTIRAFIAGLAVSKLIILEGLSGTGKSRLPQDFADFIGDKASLIRVQPSWRDRNELLGYYNEFTKTFRETDFLKVWYESLHQPDNVHIIVLDEMNLARVEYYFADFLSELEKDTIQDRQIELVSDSSSKDPVMMIDGKLHIPENIWFIGTSNKDESTFDLSDKVYDRAISIRFKSKGEKFSGKEVSKRFISSDALNQAFDSAMENQVYSTSLINKVKKMDEYMQEHFAVNFGNRIEKQLEKYIPVYLACGGHEIEAFDGFFERKILRKLEGKIGEGLKRKYDELIHQLKNTFGDEMQKSFKYIDELKEKVF